MSIIHLSITSKNLKNPFEGRYLSTLTLVQLKNKLELVVGVLTQNMKIELYDENKKFVAELQDNNKTLEELKVLNKFQINVIDITGNVMTFDSNDDISNRYIMDNSKYNKLKDTARKWIRENGIDKIEYPILDYMTLGNRCIVELQNQPKRKGTIAFIGKTHFKPGNWIGIIYDEPVGKNDGSLDDKRYFTCKPNHGGFVSPKFVFPFDNNFDIKNEHTNSVQLIEEL